MVKCATRSVMTREAHSYEYVTGGRFLSRQCFRSFMTCLNINCRSGDGNALLMTFGDFDDLGVKD